MNEARLDVCDATVFNADWRKRCCVKPCKVTDIDCFLERHYLHKRPAVRVLNMVMLDRDRPVGCVVYSIPTRETEVRYGGKTWELARLYIEDSVPKNAETWLISQSVRWIRKNFPSVCTLVSYADPSAGHSGTIYKAANWIADGMSSKGYDYYDARTGKKYGRYGNMPTGSVIERKQRVRKHRFVMKIKEPRQPMENR